MSGRSFEPGGDARGEFTVAAIEQRRGTGRHHRHRGDLLHGKMAEDVSGAAVVQRLGAVFVGCSVSDAIFAGHFVHCVRIVPVSYVLVVHVDRGHLGRHAASRLPAETGCEHGQQHDQDEEAGEQHGHRQQL